MECGRGDIVTWCAGHILELAEPDAYRPEYKTWTIEHLPIAPDKWKLAVSAPDLFKTIKSLLPKAHEVVNAGDPDREGQLLVDEVLEHLSYRGPVSRILVSDLNPAAVRKALGALQPNAKFRGLYDSARARQRADWLYGLNLTRLYTVLGRAGGHDGILSVGRVQTPLLGLIVRRDLEIEGFTPKPYYVLSADVRSSGGTFRATWIPRDDAGAAVDAEKRLVDPVRAQALVARCSGQRGRVVKSSREKKAEAPPLPYSLADLQVDAGKRLGLTPKQTLDACQALYETHRLTTYPRSDCQYLPEGHFAQAPSVLAAVAENAPALAELAHAVTPASRSKAWNDTKVTAHHAIIPTPVSRASASLSPTESGIYELIARRYIAQFYPAFEFNQTQIEIDVADERFGASGRQPIAEGWRRVISSAAADVDEAEAPDDAAAAKLTLPLLQEREEVQIHRVDVAEKKTTPPKRFTDATLVQAMTGIARFVTDPKIKKMLRETDGIGTPATQAAIIQTLYDRDFIAKKGRQIISTSVARALIQILPSVATTPDMTALWEAAMKRIAAGEMPLDAFVDGVLLQLKELIARGRARGPLAVPGARACPAPGCKGFLRRRTSSSGAFLSCTRYPACTHTSPESGAATSARAPRAPRRPRARRSA
ncbi:MAG TPA: DNA topoisomerase III [Polyangia bacterium]|nr:DNA topoisomerase III [Polyangia bacterium]